MTLIMKTTVGHALKQLLPENVAFIISTFLVKDPEENKEEYKQLCATLYGTTMKGKNMTFLRYCENLRYDSFFVYSYDTDVIQLNWETEQPND